MQLGVTAKYRAVSCLSPVWLWLDLNIRCFPVGIQDTFWYLYSHTDSDMFIYLFIFFKDRRCIFKQLILSQFLKWTFSEERASTPENFRTIKPFPLFFPTWKNVAFCNLHTSEHLGSLIPKKKENLSVIFHKVSLEEFSCLSLAMLILMVSWTPLYPLRWGNLLGPTQW